MLGGQNTFRGFGAGRFVENSRILFQGEQRFRVFDFTLFKAYCIFEPAFFVETGRVFDRTEVFKLEDWHVVLGGALRLVVPASNLVAKIDVGVSEDGSAAFEESGDEVTNGSWPMSVWQRTWHYAYGCPTNGCFWHGHKGCRYFVVPKARTRFWLEKINGNRTRDRRNFKKLKADGWHVLEIWECSLKHHFEATMWDIENYLNSLDQELLTRLMDDNAKSKG